MTETVEASETWRVKRVTYPTGSEFAFIEANGETIAEVYGHISIDGKDVPVVAARANLMAAAPDLLAALKAMEKTLCDGFDTQAQRFAGRKALIAARAAIAKAAA